MKKSLIALAAVAASGFAMAQSSVTLYGVADVAVGYNSDKGPNANIEKKTAARANSIFNNGTSRIGFRGVEDLGGGLKANFQFEQGVSLADGSTQAKTFARQAWVGLSGDFGTLRLGRQLTPSFNGIAAWEITGTANYSVVANQFGYAGAGSRDDAMIQYITPNFGGFKAHLAYVLEDNRGTDEKYDLALIYGNGPFKAALTYANTGEGKANASVGASYDFKFAKVAASYFDGHYDYMRNASFDGFSVGASIPFNNFSLTFDVARNSEFKDTDFVVEGKYALSKRTFVYAMYLNDGKKFTRDSNTGKNNFSVGLRHNF